MAAVKSHHPLLPDGCSLAPKASRNLAARLLTPWILTGFASQDKSMRPVGRPLSPVRQGPFFEAKTWKKTGRSFLRIGIQMANGAAICNDHPPWAELLRCHHSLLRASPIPNCRTCRQSHATWGRSSPTESQMGIETGGITPNYCQCQFGRSSLTSG